MSDGEDDSADPPIPRGTFGEMLVHAARELLYRLLRDTLRAYDCVRQALSERRTERFVYQCVRDCFAYLVFCFVLSVNAFLLQVVPVPARFLNTVLSWVPWLVYLVFLLSGAVRFALQLR